jgi:hypothetical protein
MGIQFRYRNLVQGALLEDLDESKSMILKWMFCNSAEGILIRSRPCPTPWVCEDVLKLRVSGVGVAMFALYIQ